MFNQKQRCANIVLFTIVAFSAGSIGPAESTNAWIDDSTQRRLSYQRIAGYTPETLVTSEVRKKSGTESLILDTPLKQLFFCIPPTECHRPRSKRIYCTAFVSDSEWLRDGNADL